MQPSVAQLMAFSYRADWTLIEYGSGSYRLQEFVSASVPDDEFQAARVRVQAQEGVSLRDKEHFSIIEFTGPSFPHRENRRVARSVAQTCNGAVERAEQRYCLICGAYPC